LFLFIYIAFVKVTSPRKSPIVTELASVPVGSGLNDRVTLSSFRGHGLQLLEPKFPYNFKIRHHALTA
jgi:hypothetical protein